MDCETDLKQVIVVRTDLRMGRGKLAAQVAHAAVSAAESARSLRPLWHRRWIEEGQKKIVLKTRSLEELLDIYRKAVGRGLPAVLVRDRGLTQLPPGTITAVGIGPAPSSLIDAITGNLKLL